MPELEKEVIELRAKLVALELERSLRQMVEQSNLALANKIALFRVCETALVKNADHWKQKCLKAQEELANYKRHPITNSEEGHY